MKDTFCSFVDAAKTPFHAKALLEKRFQQAGFSPAQETLQPAKAYYQSLEESLFAAFRMPKGEVTSILILASHLDSPCLKLKPCPQKENVLLIEPYGAPNLSTWMDRDLCVAGRVIYEDLRSSLIDLEELSCIIPNLPIHLTKKGTLNPDPQEHYRPLLNLNRENLFSKWEKKPLDFDLFVLPKEKASCLGSDQSLISSPRLDNLTSVFSSLLALENSASRENTLQMALFFDHEEIGSETSVGAYSSWLQKLLDSCCPKQPLDRSFIFSLDVAHGLHPNYPSYYDPENTPHLGKGPALKYSANQKYATSALGAASLQALAKRHAIPIQKFSAHNLHGSGSTIGPILASRLGMQTVDLGIPSLAMHSIRETVALKDIETLTKLMQTVLEEL